MDNLASESYSFISLALSFSYWIYVFIVIYDSIHITNSIIIIEYLFLFLFTFFIATFPSIGNIRSIIVFFLCFICLLFLIPWITDVVLAFILGIIDDIKILNTDFEEAVSCAKKHDFVYFDPPYDTDTSIFNSYTETGFDKDEQRRLAKVFYELDKKGVYVMLSNHNTNLIKELYKDYNIYKVKARRNINSNASKRGLVEEVIITNFKNEESF